MRTPITYYGGKQTLLKHILPLIPKHTIYTEAFCGGAAVFFAKKPAEAEVINDINQDLVNFYNTLQCLTAHLVTIFLEVCLRRLGMQKMNLQIIWHAV